MNEKIKKIYMHVGVAKSGTSSLQMSLLKSRDQLKKLEGGFLYPKLSFFHHGRLFFYKFMNGLPKMREYWSRFKGDKEKLNEYVIKECEKFEKEVENTNCQNLIISGEHIARLKVNQLEEMKSYLLKLIPNAEIQIIFCSREHTSRLTSQLVHRTKVGGEANLSKIINRETTYYQKKIQKFITVFKIENIIAYQFEDIKKFKDGPIGLFLNKIGVSADNIKLTNYRANEGYSAPSIELLLYINKRLPLIKDKKINPGRVIFDTQFWGKLDGAKYLLPEEVILNAHTRCIDDKIWLRDNFDIDYVNIHTTKFDSGLLFNKLYYKQFKYLFIKVRPVIQKLSYDYIKETKSSGTLDNNIILELGKLIIWMDRISLEFGNEDLSFFKQNNEKRYRGSIFLRIKSNWFLGRRYLERHGFRKFIIKLYRGYIKK